MSDPVTYSLSKTQNPILNTKIPIQTIPNTVSNITAHPPT